MINETETVLTEEINKMKNTFVNEEHILIILNDYTWDILQSKYITEFINRYAQDWFLENQLTTKKENPPYIVVTKINPSAVDFQLKQIEIKSVTFQSESTDITNITNITIIPTIKNRKYNDTILPSILLQNNNLAIILVINNTWVISKLVFNPVYMYHTHELWSTRFFTDPELYTRAVIEKTIGNIDIQNLISTKLHRTYYIDNDNDIPSTNLFMVQIDIENKIIMDIIDNLKNDTDLNEFYMINLIEQFIFKFKYPLKEIESDDKDIDYKCLIAAAALNDKYPGKKYNDNPLFTYNQLILWSLSILFCKFYFEISIFHAFFLEIYIIFVLIIK